MRTICALLLLLSAVLSARAVLADEKSLAREHFIKGTKSFDLGLYDEAIDELMTAYKAKDDPAILYNIAQAHRLAGHTAEALRFYRVYLVKVPHAPNRDDVEVKVAELQKAIEQQKKTQTELPPDQVIKPSSPTEPPVAAPREEPKLAPAPVAVPAPLVVVVDHSITDRRLKVGGIATLSVGVALLAGGIGMAVLASQTADDISRAPTFNQHQLDSYHVDQALEGVFLGLGAAAAVTGVVTYAVGWHRSRSPRLSVAPASTPGGAVVHLAGTW